MRRSKNSARSAVAVTALTVLLAGCGSSGDGGVDASTGSTQAKAGGVTVTDGEGAKVTVPGKVSRVVCLTAVCDDALLELGLTPVASTSAGKGGLLSDSRFLGAKKAAAIPKIGGSFGQENVEDVIAQEPDLVVGLAGAHDGLKSSLSKAAPFYLAKIASYQDSERFLAWMGQVTGREKQATAAVDAFEAKLAKAREGASKGKSSLAVFGTDTNFSVGTEKSLIGSVLSQAGAYPWPYAAKGQGEEHEPGQGTYSLEQILKKDPTVIFVETFSFGAQKTAPISEQLKKNAVWSKLDAVEKGHVYEVNTQVWAECRGLRCLGLVADEASARLRAA